MEKLQKDMGAVSIQTIPQTGVCVHAHESCLNVSVHVFTFFVSSSPGSAYVAGPSDLIFMRGNPDEVEEEVDSDTDDIDHAGESKIMCKSNIEIG